MTTEHKHRAHITHIVGTPKAGGVQKLVLALAQNENLAKYKHSVICTIGTEGELLSQFRERGINVRFCLFKWPGEAVLPSYRANKWFREHLIWTFPWRFARLLRETQADLVHTHLTAHTHLQAKAVVTLANLPWIWTLHGLYASRGEDTARWSEVAELVNRSPAIVTGVSQAALDDLPIRETIDQSKLAVVHNGINVVEYNRHQEERSLTWRHEWSIPNEAVLFGTVGRLVEVKQHDLLIEAAAILAARGCRAYFAVAGDGPLLDSLVSRAKELGVAPYFRFLGFQHSVAAFLRQLDSFVLSSKSEAMPLALIEACALGLPCIATRVGGVEEVLGLDGGILVPANSPERLADAMQQMLSPAKRASFAAKSVRIATRFSIDATASKYAQLYERMLSSV